MNETATLAIVTTNPAVRPGLGIGLAFAVAAIGACFGTARPAIAQDAATIQSIQQQIQQLRVELKTLRTDAARREAELKQARDNAARARVDTAPSGLSVPSTVKPGSAVVTMPPNDKDTSGTPFFNAQKPNGTFNVGGLTITLGGFIEMDGTYRGRNENAGASTSYSGIPFRNSPNYNTGELRATGQRTRFSLLTEGSPYPGAKLSAYFESDFNSAGSSSNSVQSNSYTMRIRQAFVEYDDNNYNLHILGGQAYSLLVPFKSGMTARAENIPPTLEDNYIQGFAVARQPQIRVTASIGDIAWLGASMEAPQTTFAGSKPTITDASILTGSVPFSTTSPVANTGTIAGGNLNPLTSYSYNTVPDIIVKTALEPGFGHYELFGIARIFKDEKVISGGSGSVTATGGGIGASAFLPVIPGLMELSGNVLAGYGIGRYGPGGLPDATYKADGSPQPLPELMATIGVVAHPTPKLDLFAFTGIEAVERKFGGTGASAYGYGNPTFVNTGCDTISAAAVQPACAANTRTVAGIQVGGWYTWLHGGYGTLTSGLQYQFDKRTVFRGMGGAPGTDENIVQVIFRYTPFQ